MQLIDGQARLLGDRSRRVPGLRAPDRSRAGGAGRPRQAADADRSGAGPDRQARLRSTSGASSTSYAPKGRPIRGDPAGRAGRGPRRPSSGRRPTRRSRRCAAGDRRHLPGARSSTAAGSATPTSCCASSGPSDARAVELRGRGHEAGRPRRAQRVLQTVLYSELLAGRPGRRAGVDARRARRQRPGVEHLRVDRLRRLLPRGHGASSRRSIGGRRRHGLPARRHVPDPVEHCDVCRWQPVLPARGAGRTTSRSSPASRPDQRTALRGARRRRPGRARRRLRAADAAAARRRTRRRRLARVRDQAAHPGRGRARWAAIHATSCCRRAGCATASLEPEPRPPVPARAVARRPLLRHRGRSVRPRRRGRLPLRRARAGAGRAATASRRSTRSGRVDRGRRGDARRRAARLRGARSTSSWIGSRRTRTSTSTTTRRTSRPRCGRLMGRYGTREEEVDRLLRGGRLRRPLPGRPAGRCGRRWRATRSRSWSRSTASSARSTCATPGRASSAFEEWLELGEAERRPRPGDPGPDRALQPRRLRQQPAAARLARGTAAGAGG